MRWRPDEASGSLAAALSSRLILMLKYPRPGAVKTRLIPTLGAERACALHRQLAAAALAVAAEMQRAAGVAIEVRTAGVPDAVAQNKWLGTGVTARDQGDGDLGARMERAIVAALAEGAREVIVIGGDCPGLTRGHLEAAIAALGGADVVLGPATDGGYYLIGMKRAHGALFRAIAWGGADVRAQTLAAARNAGLSVAQLDPLSDVDVADDLPVWADSPAGRASGRTGVSVIVPALNEEVTLPATLGALGRERLHEVIVVDGGSADRTAEVARAHEAILLHAVGGRAAQMNRGAAAATGEFLLFLHADTLPPPGCAEIVRATLARPGVAGGAFAFAIDGEFFGRHAIEAGTNWRARRVGLPYGDQGLFLRRDSFFAIGGFPALPIMEDYELVRRLRARGRIAIAPAAARTSGRRWRERGALRTTLLNQLVVAGYSLGVAPTRLARWYRGE